MQHVLAGFGDVDHGRHGTVTPMTVYTPITDAHGPEGHLVRWATWDGEHHDTTSIRWENEGFTVNGRLTRERVEYVLRISPTWHVRQFILFRDLEDPDLWLATDGAGRWGEMNGAHRTELDGFHDVHLDCTPFTPTVPIRRLSLMDHLSEGDTAEVPVVSIDTDSLAVTPLVHRYTRIASHRWRIDIDHRDTDDDEHTVEFDVDEHGVVIDYPERFRRLS